MDKGLFSTPQQVLAAERQARAAQDPRAQLNASLFELGRTASGGIGKLFGGEGLPESEAVKMARISQETLRGLDVNDPQSYFERAKRLNQAGLTQESLKLGKIGNDLLAQQQTGAAKGKGRGDYWTHKTFVNDEGITVSVPYNHRTNEYDWSSQKSLSPDGLLVDPKDAKNQGAIASAKKRAEVRAKEETEAQVALPAIKSDSTYLTNIIDQVINHPAFSDVVGAPSIGKVAQYVPGTPEADFKALQEQVSGKTFMQAYKTLKGGGQITEIEGTKATDAIQRMKTSSSEEAYMKAATDFKNEVQRFVRISEIRAGMSPVRVKLDQRASERATQSAKDANGDMVYEINGIWQYADGKKYGAK